ncbi:hypothetical protein [Bradyrhizobium liaoningense]
MRIYRPVPAEHEQIEHMLRIARECRELLKQPPPDTFLGAQDAGRASEGGGGWRWRVKGAG